MQFCINSSATDLVKTPEKDISFVTPFWSINTSSASATLPAEPLRASITCVKLNDGISTLSIFTRFIPSVFAVPIVVSACIARPNSFGLNAAPSKAIT